MAKGIKMEKLAINACQKVVGGKREIEQKLPKLGEKETPFLLVSEQQWKEATPEKSELPFLQGVAVLVSGMVVGLIVATNFF